jgi:hypothetical protein
MPSPGPGISVLFLEITNTLARKCVQGTQGIKHKSKYIYLEFIWVFKILAKLPNV